MRGRRAPRARASGRRATHHAARRRRRSRTTAHAQACAGSTYSYGSGACSPCAPGSAFISAAAGCAPPTPPTDAIYYLSGTQAEGVAALPLSGPAPYFLADHSGAPNGALAIPGGTYFSLGVPANMMALFNFYGMAATAASWVRCSAASSAPMVVAQFAAPGQSFTGATGSGLVLAVGESSIAGYGAGSFPVCDGAWHHIALVIEALLEAGTGSPISYYLDGALQYSDNCSCGSSVPEFGIAWNYQLSAAGGQLFSGAISDLRIYARALSDSEVGGLASACAAGSYSYGSGTCSPCAEGATFDSSTAGCAPPALLSAAGIAPIDTAFYLSGTQAEGTAAFIQSPNGSPSFIADHKGVENGALGLSGATYLQTSPVGNRPAPPSGDAMSATAWVKCAPQQSKQVVLTWGIPSGIPAWDGSSGVTLVLAVTVATATLANSYDSGLFPVCDSALVPLFSKKTPHNGSPN